MLENYHHSNPSPHRTLINFLEPEESSYVLTRSIFLRFIGFIYFVAFLIANRQALALIGVHGLLPANLFLQNIHSQLGGSLFDCFWQLPTIFWWNCTDSMLLWITFAGLIFSLLIMAGMTNAAVMAVQWLLYLSFVNIGQLFYGYGWETMTLEAGFLAIFLCPVTGFWPQTASTAVPKVIVWFYRWMLFRLMFGAGLIKIRGDECWRNLTCLAFHYETQPLPNPISWYLHQMPLWFHKSGCLFNHFAELIVPFFYFAPRRLRHIAGAITVLFQTILILSGNLSFLNWLTIAIAIPCFDDAALAWLFRRKLQFAQIPMKRIQRAIVTAVAVILIYFSVNPIRNMLSSHQMMNASFNQFHIMNTYGAFGVVGRKRDEIILEGTNDDPSDQAQWSEYEFLAKPGNPKTRPPFIAPYQSRIDWQMWFAAMENYEENPWLVHFVYKLLKGDHLAIGLLKSNPFPNEPPRYIRAELYEYRFTRDHSNGSWWERKWEAHYLPVLSLNDEGLKQYIQAYGWSE